jgi:hypothetical protein
LHDTLVYQSMIKAFHAENHPMCVEPLPCHVTAIFAQVTGIARVRKEIDYIFPQPGGRNFSLTASRSSRT